MFNTSQRTEDTEVVRVDLTLKAPKFPEDQFRDLFRDEPGRPGGPGGGPAANPASGAGGAGNATGGRRGGEPPKPIEIVFDEIRRRVSTVALPAN